MATTYCNECNKSGEDGYNFHQSYARKEYGDYVYLCDECTLKRWICPIQFSFSIDIPQDVVNHLKSLEMLKRLNKWFQKASPMFPVNVFHRREVETIEWQYKYERLSGGKVVLKPYAYRGYCAYDRIVLIYDETETLESMEWMLYHELGHYECQKFANMTDDAMDVENKNEGRDVYDWEGDIGHEADSEERHVNRIANAFMGGREFSRVWWRPRVTAFLAGEPMPDPFTNTINVDLKKMTTVELNQITSGDLSSLVEMTD